MISCMRTTVDLDEELLRRAEAAEPSRTKKELLEKGLRALVAKSAARRLIALAGTMPNVKAPPRRRKWG